MIQDAFIKIIYTYTANPSHVCGGQDFFTENNGEILSHVGYTYGHYYGKNINCMWTVEAPEGMMVELIPIDFHLSNDTGCVVH